jgi:uncharacterized membrane protein HdeD (DUF308 family)
MDEIVLTGNSYLTRHWWAPAVRGVFAILLGLLAFIWPGFFAEAVILIFGVYFLIQGLFTLLAAGGLRREPHRGSLIFHGLIGIGAGLALILLPGVFVVIAIWVIAFWALATGILEIGAAFNLPPGSRGKWLFALSGVFSIVIGIVLLARPGAGVTAVLWLIGIYAIAAGVTMLGVALRLRAWLK